MKKLLFLALVALTSCAGSNDIKKVLKDNVLEKSGKDVNYRLIDYNVTDTMKVSDRLNMLRMEILENGNLCDDMTKDSILKIKDTEFPDYLLKGETLNIINGHKHTIDSLADNWDKVSPYSFVLNFEEIWFFSTELKAMGENVSEYQDKMNWMQDNRSAYEEAADLSKREPDEVYGYRIEHNYTIFNSMLNKDVNIKNIVILDKNLKLISSENANSVEDMLKQITE